jgi:hypothetical protein
VATTLEKAAGDLRDLGDDQNAAAVEEIVAAIETYREVAEGGGDTVAATNQLLDSFDTLDCTGA